MPKNCDGMGDVVAMVAEPIKRKLQHLLPENIATMLNNCGCQKRREMMNKLIPFTN